MINLQDYMINPIYERDDFGSYLIIKPEINELIEYQVEMLSNNRISGLLEMDLRCKNNEEYLYYKITSKIPLYQFLLRKKISKIQLLNLLKQITDIMLSGVNYLLYNKCYILKQEFIYVDPATLEIFMVYIPVIMNEDINKNLRKLVIDLIINTTYAEDEESGDSFFQKIINYLKGETFNIAGLNRLLIKLSEDNSNIENSNETDEMGIESNTFESNNITSIGKIQENIKLQPKNNSNKSYNFKLLAIGMVVQFILLTLFIISRKFLYSLSGNIKTTYAALALIIIAIEALLIKNLLERKKSSENNNNIDEIHDDHDIEKINNIKNTQGSNDEPEHSMEDLSDIRDVFSNDDRHNNQGGFYRQTERNKEFDNRTVLLSVKKERKACLVNMVGSSREEVLIDKKDFLIGRLEGMVDYVIKNNTVGKIHAQVITRENRYYLKDLNSTNGTLINDIKIECNVENEIKDGDRITFANSDYLFVLKNFI